MKSQTAEYQNLPEYEWTAMRLAKKAGARVVPFALYDIGGELAYLTKRIDRRFSEDTVSRYAMEDFCQLSERLAEDKYKGSYESCIKVVRQYSARPGLDVSELFLRLIISFIIGNSDLHLKNFSLIEDAPGTRIFGLSDAYDILPVNIVEPRDYDETALSLGGKKRGIELADYLQFADYCGIDVDTGRRIIQDVCAKQPQYIELLNNTPLSDERKSTWSDFISARCKILSSND